VTQEKKYASSALMIDSAIKYGQLGWKLLPCHGFDEKSSCTCGRGHKEPKDAGKHAAINRWNEFSSSDEYDIKKWWGTEPNYNIALHCLKTGIFVIDIDPRGGGDTSYQKLIQILDEQGLNLPVTVEAVTGSYTVNGKIVRGRHIYFKCDTGESLVGNLASLGMPGVDIKHSGYVMLPPSRHFSGTTYEWFEGRDPWSIDVAEAPEQLLQLIRKKRAYKSSTYGGIDWNEIEEQAEKLNLKALFKDGITEGERNVVVYKIAVTLANKFSRNGVIDDLTEEFIINGMREYNRTKITPPLEEEGSGGLIYQVRRAINFVRDNPPEIYSSPHFTEWLERQQLIEVNPEEVKKVLGEVAVEESATSQNSRLLIHKALREGKSIYEATSRDTVDFPKDLDAISVQDGGVPGKRSLSDLGNSRRLVDNFGYGIAYTPDLGYKIWDEGYWKTDKEGLHVQEIAKNLPAIIHSEMLDMSDQNSHLKWQAATRSNARIRSAIEGAKSDPRIHVELEEWDKNPDLFGAGNGIVNLRTGEFMENAPEHRISMKSPIKYIPGYTNDKWQNFLDDVTNRDKEYQKYLQRAAGYSITGRSNLDIIFLMYGPPGTGKNTYIESIVKAAGEYSWPLDLSVIAQSNGMSSNSDLYHIAELFGKRISWVDELPEGDRLKENTMKKLSGSSLMSARSPGSRPFSFYMKAKIWISSNHRPAITDDAMWRRLVALPFVHVPEKIDPHLKEYLSDPEGGQPAVLAWMIEGAVDYLNNPAPGANPIGYSKVVHESTELYRKSEDKVAMFIEEELQKKEGSEVLVSAVYTKYQSWTQDQGDRFSNQLTFQKKLMDKGIRVEGNAKSATLCGWELRGFSSQINGIYTTLSSNQYEAPSRIFPGPPGPEKHGY